MKMTYRNLALGLVAALAILALVSFVIAPAFVGEQVFSRFALTSWVLGAFATIGFLLIGRRIWWAWYINMACQVCWIIYWVLQGNPGPVVTNVVYILVFAQNAWLWSHEYHVEEKYLPKNERKLGRLIPHRIKTICPECRDGKHQNCDGVGNIDAFDNPIVCECSEGTHPLR